MYQGVEAPAGFLDDTLFTMTRRAPPCSSTGKGSCELAGWPALAFRGGDGGVPSRRLMASAVHVLFKLPRL
jgi:hypothetical protein